MRHKAWVPMRHMHRYSAQSSVFSTQGMVCPSPQCDTRHGCRCGICTDTVLNRLCSRHQGMGADVTQGVCSNTAVNCLCPRYRPCRGSEVANLGCEFRTHRSSRYPSDPSRQSERSPLHFHSHNSCIRLPPLLPPPHAGGATWLQYIRPRRRRRHQWRLHGYCCLHWVCRQHCCSSA